jgi:hypothetical protein
VPAAPLHLLLACAPDASGAADLVARAAGENARGRAVRAILTGDGLRWAGDARLAPIHVLVCSRSARDRGLRPDATPKAAWSSLVAWARDLDGDAEVWAALP